MERQKIYATVTDVDARNFNTSYFTLVRENGQRIKACAHGFIAREFHEGLRVWAYGRQGDYFFNVAQVALYPPIVEAELFDDLERLGIKAD